VKLVVELQDQPARRAQVTTNLVITTSAAWQALRELQWHAGPAPMAPIFRVAVDSAVALVRPAPATAHLEATLWDALQLPMEFAKIAQLALQASTRSQCVVEQAIQLAQHVQGTELILCAAWVVRAQT